MTLYQIAKNLNREVRILTRDNLLTLGIILDVYERRVQCGDNIISAGHTARFIEKDGNDIKHIDITDILEMAISKKG